MANLIEKIQPNFTQIEAFSSSPLHPTNIFLVFIKSYMTESMSMERETSDMGSTKQPGAAQLGVEK